MLTDNVSGADNQQESSQEEWLNHIPQSLGYYLSGFSDGEGSFNVSFRHRSDYKYKWQPVLSFNVSQKDRTNLLTFQEILGCGIIKRRQDGLYSFDVTTPSDVILKVIPFFTKFPLRSNKLNNFMIFCEIAKLMIKGNHKTIEGLVKISNLREVLNMGKGRTRKYSAEDIFSSILEKSSETIC